MRRFNWLAVLLVCVLGLAPSASAQTSTTNVPMAVSTHEQSCFYTAFISLGSVDSTATYYTVALPIGDMASEGLSWYASPSSDTVSVALQVGYDGAIWSTMSNAATDSLTASYWATSTDAALKASRFVRFAVGYAAGSVGTISLGAKVPLASGVTGNRNCFTVRR